MRMNEDDELDESDGPIPDGVLPRRTPIPFAEIISLLEAFEMLGAWTYGSIWSGYEFIQARVPYEDFSAHRVNLGELRTAIDSLQSRETDLIERKDRTLRASEIEQLNGEIELLRTERRARAQEIDVIKRILEAGKEADLARWERREHVEDQILSALADGALSAIRFPEAFVPRDDWKDRSSFTCYIPISYVHWHRTKGALRRTAAFLNRKKFELWCRLQSPADASMLDVLPAKIRAEHLAKKLIDEYSTQCLRITRTTFENRLLQGISDLKKKEAGEIWNDRSIVPDQLHLAGKPKN